LSHALFHQFPPKNNPAKFPISDYKRIMHTIEFESPIIQGMIKIPEQFQEWQDIQTVKVILLRCDAVSQLSEADYLALMERFSYAQPGHHWSRDELNGR
jgi:hypothetical protein